MGRRNLGASRGAELLERAFFTIFGIDRRRVTAFEKQVGMSRAGHALKNGRIDAFWKGVLLIEHKSVGQNLERAFAQAVDYFDGLPERDLPRYVLVSDFETGEETEFALKDLHKHIRRFGFIAGYQAQVIKPQDPVNLRVRPSAWAGCMTRSRPVATTAMRSR